MNRAELVASVSERVRACDAARAVDALVAVIVQEMLADRGVSIREFGVFSMTARADRVTGMLMGESHRDVGPLGEIGEPIAFMSTLEAGRKGRTLRPEIDTDEAIILTRHRRGRQPHIIAVTAEPLPTRIASLARGTGEVDGVYHVALPQLQAATAAHGSKEQRDTLDELIGQSRLFDIRLLPAVLAD